MFVWSNKPSLKAVRRELTSLLPGRVTGKRQDERLSQERNSAPFSSEKAFPVRTEAESPMVLTGIRGKWQRGGCAGLELT